MASARERLPQARLRTFRTEWLEPRRLLSAAALESIAAHSSHVVRDAASGFTAALTPAQIRHAYGFDQIQFAGAAGDGRGETIAIVDAYDDPGIVGDLGVFDQQFGLAAPPSFAKVYASGSAPRSDSGWSEEIALDVEWAHAIAPGANIVLVEARSDNLSDLLSAVNVARYLPNVNAVSMSWGVDEFSGETTFDGLFTTPAGGQGITFVAASGDDGAGTIWPAASPNVLAVGGTSLGLAGNSYGAEAAWSDGGGGLSPFESEPSFQFAVQLSGARSIPDVAYDADPNTGLYVYDSAAGSRHSQGGWLVVGGTSAGSPQWAALAAIADQGRAVAGRGSLGNAQSLLYQLPGGDFHDIVAGNNGFSATAGYDFATGRGSPAANLLVPDLANISASGGGGAGGLPSNLAFVAASLTHSAGYDAVFVARAYETYLGRDVDSQGLAWWISQMQSGATDEQVEAALIGSTEYVQLRGGTNGAWVDAMYGDLLGRAADPSGRDYWINQLQLGASRSQIALGIAASPEREAIVVKNDYFTYLGRMAAAQDVDFWSIRFAQGARNEDIISGFIGSAEYYNGPDKGQGSAAGWLDSVYQDLFQRPPTDSETTFWLALLE